MIRFILADMKRMSFGGLVIVLLIALATALTVTVTLQERAVRLGSARAADKFDLVIGAAGSPTQLMLSSVFLQISALPLVSGKVLDDLQNDKRVAFAAPLGFGDSYFNYQIIGTNGDFINNLYQGLSQGHIFQKPKEAVIGANVDLKVGQKIMPMHGSLATGGHAHEGHEYIITGRLKKSDTVWDNAILVTIEDVWHVHGLGEAHEHEDEHDEATKDDEIEGDALHEEHSFGVPAIMVKPKTIGDAYKLRQEYRTEQTLAVFPAEVLTSLYATLGDIRGILAIVAIGAQILVGFCILFVAFLHIETRRKQIAALRVLGITRPIILSIVWSEIFILLSLGILSGFALGYVATMIISQYLGQASGIILPVEWASEDLTLLWISFIVAAVLALLPAFLAFRQKAALELRD